MFALEMENSICDHTLLSTVVPTKRDSDEIFCLQLLSKFLV